MVGVLALGCGARPAPTTPTPVATPQAPAQSPVNAARAAEAAMRPQTALRLWREAAQADPGDPEPQRSIVRLVSDKRDALPHLLWLAGRDDATPSDVAAYADTLIASGRPAEALGVVEIARRRLPAEVDLMAAEARALLGVGRLSDALALREAMYAGPDAPARRAEMARALAAAGLEDRAEAEWSAALSVAPDARALWIGAAQAHQARRRHERAVGLLREARVRFPGAPDVLAALADALESAGDAATALDAWDEAIVRMPKDPALADGRARTLLAAGKVDEAMAAWEAAVKAFPEAESPRMHLALAYRVREAPKDVVRILRPWAALRPEDPRAWLALGEAEAALDLPEAVATLQRAASLGAEPRLVLPMLARAVAEHGGTEAARDLFAQAVEVDPGNVPLRMGFALHCLRIGDLACAETVLAGRLARDPFDPRARELLEGVLSGHPDASSRLSLASEWPAARSDATLAALAAQVEPAAGEILATVLRDEREVRVDAGRVARVLHRRSVLVQRPGGVERYREVIVSFNVRRPAIVHRARLLTPDGEVRPLPAEAMPVRDPNESGPLRGDAREQVLRFDGLEPGAIIDYEVEVPLPHPDDLGAWWDRYVMSNVDPTVQASYVLDVPEDARFGVDAPGMGPPAETRAAGRRRLAWVKSHLPPTALEGDDATVAHVSVASVSDWSGVSRWFSALFEPQTEITPVVAAAARRATVGLKSRRARIAALYGLVESTTEYLGDELGIGAFRPRPATQTLERGEGDCKDVTALLAALLRAVGIPAWAALVRPEGPGIFGEDHPTPAQFTHVLLYVPDPDGDFWLDATARLGTVDAVPGVLRGRLALVVDDRGGRVVRIPDGEPRRSRLVETLSLALTTTGGGALTRAVTAWGDVAAEVRQRLSALNDVERRALLRSPGLFLGGAHRPDEITWDGLGDPAGPLSLTGTLTTRDLVGLRTDGALVVRLDLDSLVAPVLAGANGGQLGGRRIERSFRLRPPGGVNAFSWPPMRIRHKTKYADLRVDERRRNDETVISVTLDFAGLPRDSEERARWLETMEFLKTKLDRDLVMKPGPGFDAVTFFGALAAERPGDGAPRGAARPGPARSGAPPRRGRDAARGGGQSR
jgi:tetratricopeptide (TPR) repeat protein